MIDIAAVKAQAPKVRVNPAAVRSLHNGELTMSPHPTWSLPRQLSWAEDPFKDKNWRYQLHMLRWLAPLVDAGRAGDRKSAEAWLSYASDWIKKNPPGAGKDPAAWANMVDGVRAFHLIRAAPMVAEYFPDSLALLEKSINDHGSWLANEKHLGHSNHALHQHEGLLLCGLALRKTAWTDLAVSRLEKLLQSEWDSEGISAEGAVAYHRNNYLWWQRLFRRINDSGLKLPEGADTILENTPLALAHATRPDGMFAPIGDTDGGSATKIKHPACQYVTSQGSQGAPPEELFRLYKDGYAFGRSGWGEFERDMSDETFFAMPFGRYKVHGHADGGSLIFSSVGVNWVTDPGKYSYTASDPFRQHVIAHDSHSLMYVEGVDRKAKAPVPLLEHQERDDVWDITVSDEGYEGIGISRRILYSTSGEYLVVLDTVRSDRDITAVQRWQLGENVSVAEASSHLVSLQSGSSRAALYSSGTKPTTSILEAESTESLDGRIATGWKQSVAAPAIEFRKHGKSFRFVTVLSGGRKQEPKFITVKGLPAGVLGLHVDNGASHETMVIAGSQVQIMEGQVTAEEVISLLKISPKSTPAKASLGKKKVKRALSRSEHQKIISAIASARSSARGLTHAQRQTLATKLEAQVSPLVNGLEFDLGLDACLRDLRMDVARRALNLSTTRSPLINWSQDESWRPTYYDFPLWTHFGAWDTNIPLETSALHTLELGPLVLPALIEPHPGNVLTVMFHGALNRTKSKLPVFQRMAVQRELEAGPILGLSDATLDLGENLRLGWYMGVGDLDLTTSIADLIRAVASKMGVDHVVLQGNSGGGFAAMHVAAQLPEAHSVVFNPQTDIRRYFPAQTIRIYETVFGHRSEPTATRQRMRLSVGDRVRATGTLGASLTFVSNTGDELHVTEHEKPLLETLSKLDVPTVVHREELYLGEGHKTVDNDGYKEIMNDVYARLRLVTYR